MVVIAPGAPCGEAPQWQKSGAWVRLDVKLRHEQGVAALGFKIVRDATTGWPRLSKDGLMDRRTYYTWPTAFCDLGEIRAHGVSKAPVPREEGDWTHVRISYGDKEKPCLRIWASRVSPALLLQTPEDSITLFCRRKAFAGFKGRGIPIWRAGHPPALLAAPRGKGVEVRALALVSGEESALEIAQEEGTWALCWFGKGAGIVTSRRPFPHAGRHWINPTLGQADCPVLMVFDSPPESITLGRNGLRVTFARAKANRLHSLALAPLHGDLFPLATETDRWRKGLPEHIVAQCRWWNEHLADVPYSVSERYAYDAAKDIITVTEDVRYLRIRDGGQKLAPLPPMVALALTQGFPMKLRAAGRKASLVESSVLTFFGPYCGVEGADSYSYAVSGLGKLVKGRPVTGKPVAADAHLVRALAKQIRRMLEAGHLAPWYCARNCYGAGYRCYWRHQTRFVWSNPGETLYVLAQALPLLSEGLRQEVVAYMKKERAEYPPEEIAHTPVWKGARREWHRLDDVETFRLHQQRVGQLNFHVVNKLIPEETLYYLADYYQAVGAKELTQETWDELQAVLAPYLRRQDWATLGFWPLRIPSGLCCNGWGGVHDANLHFAGLVGAVRLARMMGARQDDYWGQLARAALWRYALGRYAHYLDQRKFYDVPKEPDWMARWFEGSWVGHLITYNWRGPLDDVRQVTRQSPYGLQFSDSPMDRFHGQSTVPFLGAVPELGRFARQHLRAELKSFSDRYERTMPAWHIAKCTTNVNAEFCYLAPEESYQVFLIRAWVLGEPPEKLESYLDTPWMARGDLYYIHKLSETIKAYRGMR